VPGQAPAAQRCATELVPDAAGAGFMPGAPAGSRPRGAGRPGGRAEDIADLHRLQKSSTKPQTGAKQAWL